MRTIQITYYINTLPHLIIDPSIPLIMSTSDTDLLNICANCGKGKEEAVGDLKACTACKMVKYCNRDCQIAHRAQHKKACRIRAAELHNEALFKQHPHEDCPICMLRLPTVKTGKVYKECRGKIICGGCIIEVALRDEDEAKCPFCRTPGSETDEDIIEKINKRVKVGDAEALCNLGCFYYHGIHGLEADRAKAHELWKRAAELGCAESSNDIGNVYFHGRGGIEKDEKKGIHYWELAAMGGYIDARHNLGVLEARAGNHSRALKHFSIAAGDGYATSLDSIRGMIMSGHATKDDYTNALRAYQAFLDEIKSNQRDRAATAGDADWIYY